MDAAAYARAQARLRVARYLAGRDQQLVERIAKQAQRDQDWHVLGYRNHSTWREQLPIPTDRTWSAPKGGPIVWCHPVRIAWPR